MYYALMPFAVVFGVMYLAWLKQRPSCPDCAKPLDLFQSPFTKTKRQWFEGGYLCRHCGCESDTSGRKVSSETAPNPRRLIIGLALTLIPAVVLGIGLLRYSPAPTPALVAKPMHAPLTPLPLK